MQRAFHHTSACLLLKWWYFPPSTCKRTWSFFSKTRIIFTCIKDLPVVTSWYIEGKNTLSDPKHLEMQWTSSLNFKWFITRVIGRRPNKRKGTLKKGGKGANVYICKCKLKYNNYSWNKNIDAIPIWGSTPSSATWITTFHSNVSPKIFLMDKKSTIFNFNREKQNMNISDDRPRFF